WWCMTAQAQRGCGLTLRFDYSSCVVTTQLTPGFPDSCVEKCSFTVVNSAFSPCYLKNQKQSEQLRNIFKGC
ncbi:MAG: hypothetical protein R8J85_10215, partial [Mariprofundales bacterium]